MIFVIWFLFFSLPSDLFDSPKSRVLYDRGKNLLNACVASDEQWRFPKIDSVSEKIKVCVVQYEDAYFPIHLGVNPVSIWKAFLLNQKSNQIKRGGSTITMQTIRLLRGNPSRTYLEKFYEVLMAIRMELTFSKNTILEYYVSNAPYGGNIVGIETAAWRYFGKSSHNLTWSEAATMAVLPNQPSSIYIGKNQEALIRKRNFLLKKLYIKNYLSQLDYELAIAELLPNRIYDLPHLSKHLSNLEGLNSQSQIYTTLDLNIQNQVEDILHRYHQDYKYNQILNLAAIVIDSKTGEILSYHGNAIDTVTGSEIDMIRRPRSSGSTLKPLLYASMLDDGTISPMSLLSDIPIDISGYEPHNSSYQFEGSVPASQALTRSLNVPWILALKLYGYEKFYQNLNNLGFKHFNRSALHYGLSLVVGGGDIELLELANVYLRMNFKLQNLPERNCHFLFNQMKLEESKLHLSRAAIYQTFQALSQVSRPENETNWQMQQSQKIAWKTGTSHGFKDAWAIGVNANYLIGVWVGNAEGNGRSQLTGIKKAAPIMFDILNILPRNKNSWYSKPTSEMKRIPVCKQSGYAPTHACKDTFFIDYPTNSTLIISCTYHQYILVDSTRSFRVNSACYPVESMQKISWFKLPLTEELYYKKYHPLYSSLPPVHTDCLEAKNSSFDILFPRNNSKIQRHHASLSSDIVLEAVHENDASKLFWFLDQNLIGETISEHKLKVSPSKGWHKLTVQNQHGEFKSVRFLVD